MTNWPDDDVILFDGVCVFCSRWVRFVADRDKAKRFRFTTIQSAYGARLAQALGIDPDDPDIQRSYMYSLSRFEVVAFLRAYLSRETDDDSEHRQNLQRQ